MRLRQQGILLAVVIALFAIGCSGRPETSKQVVFRFIDEEGTDLFTTDKISVSRVLQEWRFDNGRMAEGCALVTGEVESFGADGALLKALPAEITLQFRVGFEAEETDMIRVRLASLLRGGASLSWRSEGGPWTDFARIALDRWSRWGPEGNELRFEVGQSIHWTGRDVELRLRFNTRVGASVALESVTAEARSTDLESLQRALRRSWKVEIGNEWRNALLAHPGLSHERALIVPKDGRLRVAFGMMPGVRARVRFIAELITEEEVVTVVDRSLPGPSAETVSQWHQAMADLAPWVGRPVRIRLSVETEDELYDPQGLPVWGHPEVWGRPERDPRPNLVVVSIDTLRAANLSLYGHDRATSPHLERWAKEGVIFRNAVTQAPWTLPSHISIFSGLNAFRHGVNFNDSAALNRDVPMLAEILRHAGYATSAITAGGFVHPRFGFARGFDSYLYWPSTRNRTDELESLTNIAIQRLASGSDLAPFFLFFHTLEVHPPNEARQPYFSQFSPLDSKLLAKTDVIRPQKEMGFLGVHRGVLVDGNETRPLPPELATLPADLYDSAIAYTDFQLNRLLEALDNLELPRQTMVVVTSDHGEALGEDGRWGHGHLYESNLLVPLIILFPDRSHAGRAVESQVRLIDLLPTILDTVGLPPPKAVDGRSLVPLIEGRLADHPKEAWTYAASTNEGLVMRWENRLRYVLRDAAWSPLSGSEKLYDLKKDAAATTDVALDRPADAARLRARSLDVLGRQARGLRVQFRNQGTSTIQGLLESSIIEPVTVKAATASPVPVKWRGMGRLSFELDPLSDFTLIFTNVKHQSVDLRGEIGMDGCPDSVPFALSLSLVSLKNPHQTEFDIERCEVQAPTSGTLETGLRIWWIGSRPDESAGPDLDDPNLRRQLEALGYLD